MQPQHSIDPFKQFELEGWQQCVNAYDAGFSRITLLVGKAMLEFMGVGASHSIAELACGPGHLAKLASDLGAIATGVDFCPSMIERAKSNYPEIHFEVGDVEGLQLEDGSFNFAVMNFGIPHLGDPQKAIAEMARIVKPGGMIAFSSWALPTEAKGFKVVLDAVSAFGESVALPNGPSFFLFSDEGVGKDACEKAGLKFKGVEQVPLCWQFDHADDFFRSFHEGTARTGGLLRAQSEDRLQTIKEAVLEVLNRNFMAAGGLLEIPMPAKVYYAEK